MIVVALRAELVKSKYTRSATERKKKGVHCWGSCEAERPSIEKEIEAAATIPLPCHPDGVSNLRQSRRLEIA